MTSFAKLKQLDEKEQDKLYQDTIARCAPIARDVCKLVAEHAERYPFGDKAQASDQSHELAQAIIALMVERDVRWNDRDFIIQLALQPIDGAKVIITDAFSKSWNSILTGIVGKKVSELSFTEIDALLKKGQDIEK